MLAHAIRSTSPTTVRMERLPRCGRRQREGLFQITRLRISGPVERHRCGPDLRLEAPEARRGNVDRLAAVQAEHDGEPPVRSMIERRLGTLDQRLRADRDDDVDRPADVGPEESLGHHARDRERNPIDVDGAADGVFRAAEAPLPHAVAHHRDRPCRSTASDVVGFGDVPAPDCPDAEHVEHAAADPGPVHGIGRATLGEVEACGAPGKGAVTDFSRAAAHGLPDRIRPVALCEEGELLRIVDRQRLQHEAVQDREESGVRANTEGERQHRDRRHDRCGSERPPGIAEVGRQQRLHQRSLWSGDRGGE